MDLDGTLLDEECHFTEVDAAAIRRARDRGLIIVLASGRPTKMIWPTAEGLGVNGPLIAYNGAAVYEDCSPEAKRFYHCALPAKYADELIDYAHRERFQLNYVLDDVIYAEDAPDLRPYAELYAARTGALFTYVPSLARFKGNDPTKTLIVTERADPAHPNPRDRDELFKYWKNRWDSAVYVTPSQPEFLEFLNKAVSKGTALAMVAEHCGVAQEEVLALGDAENDAPMLAWAGTGVAVANASPAAKAVANYVSPLTNLQGAVAEAIERFCP
jgi:Cof subfamily protein (haloacid dehalogenase superfamily)